VTTNPYLEGNFAPIDHETTAFDLPVTGTLLMEAQLARHDPDKLARCIWERVASDFRLPQILKRRVL
jgi:hypothetical protein